MMTDPCTCTAQTHEHHLGRPCDRPAAGSAEEVEDNAPDTQLGAVCLECYKVLAVEMHDKDPDSVVDLSLPASFLLCETPRLGV